MPTKRSPGRPRKRKAPVRRRKSTGTYRKRRPSTRSTRSRTRSVSSRRRTSTRRSTPVRYIVVRSSSGRRSVSSRSHYRRPSRGTTYRRPSALHRALGHRVRRQSSIRRPSRRSSYKKPSYPVFYRNAMYAGGPKAPSRSNTAYRKHFGIGRGATGFVPLSQRMAAFAAQGSSRKPAYLSRKRHIQSLPRHMKYYNIA